MNCYSVDSSDRARRAPALRFFSALTLLFCAFPLESPAATYFVDSSSTGNDSNEGLAETAPFATVARVNSITLAPGDSVLFRRGGSFDGTLSMADSGTAVDPIYIGAWGSGSEPVIYGIDVSGEHIVFEDLVVDHRKDASDAVRMRGARHCTFRRMTVRNGTRDAFDVDQADGLLLEDVEIHHFLNGSFGSKDDSHGVAVTNTDGVTLRRVNIHHVSGDSLQADPNRKPGGIADNILIEDSELWTDPLAADFNAGWRAGNSPGENAIDTKVLQSAYEGEIRMNITLRNVVAHGWTEVPEISNRAVFNLKEKITARLDRVTVHNSEIAFRIRGNLGNADTTISNIVLYDVKTAIRAEDDLTDLRVYNTTFGDNIGQFLDLAGGDSGMPTWHWRNNAFLGAKPEAAGDSSNLVAEADDFVSVSTDDYHLVAGSSLLEAGVMIDSVTVDREGRQRKAPYDVGAYEFEGTPRRPKAPDLRVE